MNEKKAKEGRRKLPTFEKKRHKNWSIAPDVILIIEGMVKEAQEVYKNKVISESVIVEEMFRKYGQSVEQKILNIEDEQKEMIKKYNLLNDKKQSLIVLLPKEKQVEIESRWYKEEK